MAEIITHGTKVKYIYEGKEHVGKVHAVVTHETPEGQITRVAYQIDTGRDYFVNEVMHRPHDREKNKRVEALMSKQPLKPEDGKKYLDVLHKYQEQVSTHTDLPDPDEIVTEKIRQPELVEIDQNHVKPA